MNVDRCFLYLRISHLRGDGAFPDQFVESFLLTGSIDRSLIHIGRADSLVRFLCSLGMGVVGAWLAVFASIYLDDFILAGIGAEGGEVDAIGTHVGDASAFVQLLGNHHGLAHGESQLSGSLLL